MTAINALVRPDRVHLVTDGAVYEPDGRVIGTAQKVYILAHVSAAIAIRGPAWFGPGFVAQLNAGSLRDFDDLLSRIVPVTRAFLDHVLSTLDPAQVAAASAQLDLRRFNIVVAGWSHRRDRGEVHHLDTNHDEWRLEPQGAGFVMPGDNPVLVARLERAGWCLDDESRDVSRLLDLLHHQRAVPDVLPNGIRAQTVGGFAQHTEVSADGIATRILERWSA